MAYASNGGSRNTWSARFPVYQIDFTAVASGKRVATSKRRIRWRFGFSNQEALDAGESGTACRGEEHDVTVVWSITSGKRLILADGQEVHYSTTRSGVFEFSWTMRGNHVLKVVCHATPQMTGNATFRQYDLSVDGMSFFVMPKVYELGIRGPISSHAPVPGVVTSKINRGPGSQNERWSYDDNGATYNSNPPTDRQQEDEDLQRAIQNSIEESRQHLRRGTENPSTASRMQHANTTSPRNTSSSTAPSANSIPTSVSAPAPEVDLLDMGAMTTSSAPTQPYQYNTNQPTQAPAPSNQAYVGNQAYNYTNQSHQLTSTSAPPPSYSDIYMSTQPHGSKTNLMVPANDPERQLSDVTMQTIPPSSTKNVTQQTQLVNSYPNANNLGYSGNVNGTQPRVPEIQASTTSGTTQLVVHPNATGYNNHSVTSYNQYQGAVAQPQSAYPYNQYQVQQTQQAQPSAYNNPQQYQQQQQYGGYAQNRLQN